MQIYAKTYSIDPVPRVGTRKADRQWLVSLTSHMPPMYRKARK
jgi:hypothetical protein